MPLLTDRSIFFILILYLRHAPKWKQYGKVENEGIKSYTGLAGKKKWQMKHMYLFVIQSEIPLKIAVNAFKAYTYKNKDEDKRDVSHKILEAVKQVGS